MIKGLILDFDQTLVNSSKIEYLRNNREWEKIKRHYHLVELQEGVLELFEFINKHNIKVAIVSNAPRRKYLLGLIEYFNLKVDVIIGYEDVIRIKPNPEPMLKALDQLNLNNFEVISIGDQENDIISSNAAKILSIYYGKPLDRGKQLNSESFNEIVEILSKLNNE